MSSLCLARRSKEGHPAHTAGRARRDTLAHTAGAGRRCTYYWVREEGEVHLLLGPERRTITRR